MRHFSNDPYIKIRYVTYVDDTTPNDVIDEKMKQNPNVSKYKKDRCCIYVHETVHLRYDGVYMPTTKKTT